ncbi:MAG: hypothetical protein QW837_06480 [Conexivisphaerales archaeon]
MSRKSHFMGGMKANLKACNALENSTLMEGSRTESARKGSSHGLPSIGPCQKVSSEMVVRSIPSQEGKPTRLSGGRHITEIG